MRNFARMLKQTGIPFQTFDMNDRPTIAREDYEDILTPRSEFNLGRYDHVIELFTNHTPKSTTRLHALLAFWEFDTGFDFAFPDALQSGLPLVAMSDFNAHHFRAISKDKTPIFKVRHPLILSGAMATPIDVLRKKYGIPKTAFLVFFNFDYGSSYYRKNPEGVVRTFAKAFPSDAGSVLLLKTSNAEKHPTTAARLRSLASELKLGHDRLVFVEGPVPQSDMSGFFNLCDVYISLHRGEGFGIGMAEAMSYGKPVIATNYSANTEFCTEATSIPVPYKLITPRSDEIDNPAYRHVAKWAEPDIDFAAQALAKCRSDPMFTKKTGDAGAEFIRGYFSVDNFKKDVDLFLDCRPSA